MRFAVALLFFAATVGCDSSSDQARYQGALLDETGTERFSVDLQYDRPAIGRVTDGAFTLTSASGERRQGELRATSRGDGTITLSLDVAASDSGTQLIGTPVDDRFDGEWFELTIAGPVRAGTFALRLR